MKPRLVFIALSLALSGAANAVTYTQVVSDKSDISFVYKQMNAPTEGGFKRFNGQLNFDPAQPAAGSARFDIDVASIDTGSADGDDEVKGKLWFDTKTHPQARFVSTSIRPTGANRFDVLGKLTIKGRTVDVKAPASFRQEGAMGVFEGSLVIKRADFAIGEGIWADFGTVANEVQIKFRLLATAAPTTK